MNTVDDGGYGRQFADFYDRIFPRDDSAERAARWLAKQHIGGGLPAVEFGVGTGRIALPLAALAGDVVGIDSAPEMLDRLREELRANPAPVVAVHANMCGYSDDRPHGLVYCVLGTFSMLLSEHQQQEAMDAFARSAAPGASVVVETHNAALVEAIHDGRVRDSYFVRYPGRDTGLLSYSTLDVNRRLWHLSHVWFDDGRARIADELSRLTTTDEIDAYAQRAGLERVGHYGGWSGEPFTGEQPMVICHYRRPDPR